MAMKALTRWRGGMAAIVLGALLLAVQTTENSAPADAEEKAAALPADLAKIPSDGAMLLSLRVADLWASFIKPLREKEVGERVSRELEKLWGMSPEQVERWTLVLLDPTHSTDDPLLFLRTFKAYDRAKVLAAGKNVKEEKYKGHVLYGGDQGWGAYLIDAQTLVYGKPALLRALIDHPKPKAEGNLAGALRLAAGNHAVLGGLNVKAINDAVGNQLPGEAEQFRPLLQAISATLAVDIGEEPRANVSLSFPTEKDVQAAIKPAQTGLGLARVGLDQGVAELSKQKDMGQIVELLKAVQATLKSAKIDRRGKVLQASASLKLDKSTTRTALIKAVQKIREAAARTQSLNNMKQLDLAMQNYADTMRGQLPANAIYSKDGKPLLSWRVTILPYIEQQALYQQFHLNEPWDSEHNKKLLAKMPRTYASPQDEKTLKEHTTYYQAFHGKGAFFEGKQGLRFPAAFTDGTSLTIMFIEASKAVPWTKPEDIPYDPSKPLPKLGLPGFSYFLVAMCDGSVHAVDHGVTKKTLRSAITRDAGDILGSDW